MGKTLKVYTDGSCSGNPGKGGYSAVFIMKDGVAILSQGFLDTTNNKMELTALVETMKHVLDQFLFDDYTKLEVHSDSAYVVHGMINWVVDWQKNGWKTKAGGEVKNVELWKAAVELRRELENTGMKLCVMKVKAHSGDEYNEMADVAAKEAPLDGSFVWREKSGRKTKGKKKA